MFCSTIIPTINRSTLSRAVYSVLHQELIHDDFEVIVVNDSGEPLPKMDWQKSDRVRVIHTNRRERSVARNTGAAIARGRYLHFLDDDDWILPGTLESFGELAQTSQSAWLYGAYRLVDNAGKPIKEVYRDERGNAYIQSIALEWIPLQASLIDAEAFFAVGGFAPLPLLLGGCEDSDLVRQITRYYDIEGLAKVVACIRTGVEGSTTKWSNILDQNRQSREKAMNIPGSFVRMHVSANVNPAQASYWHGRIVWYYLASVKWNLQHGRLFTAVSRGVHMIMGFVLANRHILSKSFWRGLTTIHVMFSELIIAGNKDEYK